MRPSIPLCLLLILAAPFAAGGEQRQNRDVPLASAAGPSIPAALQGTEIARAIDVRDWERAERLLAAEIERAPDSPDLLVLVARVLLIDRKPLNAAIAIKKAEALGPIDNTARFTLVLAYLSLGRSDWARPELERLSAADPSDINYQYWLGRLDYDAARYAAAIARFEQVLEREPTFIRAHDNLGLCYEALHQPDRAIAHYGRAIELNRHAASKSPWPPLNLGILLRQRGELADAEALFREALGYDAQFPQGHYQLGALLEERNQLEQAATELSRAAALDPAYAEPHYALARIYRRLGRVSEATEALGTFQQLREAQR